MATDSGSKLDTAEAVDVPCEAVPEAAEGKVGDRQAGAETRDDTAAEGECQQRAPVAAPSPGDSNTDGSLEGDKEQNWSFYTAWSAFTGAVQQDVTDIAESVKRALDAAKAEMREEVSTPKEEPPANDNGVTVHEPASESGTDNDTLEEGMQRIREESAAVAAAAGRAVTEFWTGLGGALQNGFQAMNAVADKLEHAALQASKRISEATDLRTGSGPPHLVDGALEFAEVDWSSDGLAVLVPTGVQAGGAVELLGTSPAAASTGFGRLFRLYRGPRFAEELEALGSQAAKVCNRASAQLPDQLRQQLDVMVAKVADEINLLSHVPPGGAVRDIMKELCQQHADVIASSEREQLPKDGPRLALAALCSAAVKRAGTMQVNMSYASPQLVWEGCSHIRVEALKLMAEFTALGLQHLSFLAMCLEGGDAEATGLSLTNGLGNAGEVVQQVLLQLICDASAIHDAFSSALLSCTTSESFLAMRHKVVAGWGVQRVNVSQTDLSAIVQQMREGLKSGEVAALERLLEGGRHLLYPICCSAARALVMQHCPQTDVEAGREESDDSGDVAEPEGPIANVQDNARAGGGEAVGACGDGQPGGQSVEAVEAASTGTGQPTEAGQANGVGESGAEDQAHQKVEGNGVEP